MTRWAVAAFVVVLIVAAAVSLLDSWGSPPGPAPTDRIWRVTVGQGDLTTDLTVLDLSGLVVDVQPGAPDALLGGAGLPATASLDGDGRVWALALAGGACDHPLLTTAGGLDRISVVIDPRPAPGVCIEILVTYGVTVTFSEPVDSLAVQPAPAG
jgi:hypothetical protein